MDAPKTFTARELSSHSGSVLDHSQRQPVVITKQGKPFSVVVSYYDIEAQLEALAKQKEIDRAKEDILFGAKNSEMEGREVDPKLLNLMLAMTDQGHSSDEIAEKLKEVILSENQKIPENNDSG